MTERTQSPEARNRTAAAFPEAANLQLGVATAEASLSRRMLPWLGVACILVLYAISSLQLHPNNFFGITQDDTIYFSSARALAAGNGYELPSVPGTPPATKYPILFSWILSCVWRANPSFPANLAAGVMITILFGCGFLAASFVFFRNFRKAGVAGALVLTLYCAMHPVVALYSASILTEIPFAALALTALLLAETSARRDPGAGSAILCGIVAGLAILLRVLGVPIAAGIFIALLWRRAWRKSAIVAACVAPFLLWVVRGALLNPPAKPPAAFPSASSAWLGTWLYYTNYPAFWKLVVLQHHIFWPMLKENAILLGLQPGIYFLDSHFARPPGLAMVISFVLSAVAVVGIICQARRNGLQPVHFSLVLYAVPILLWDYPAAERFLLPFLPLFVAGLWSEGSGLAKSVRETLRRPGAKSDKFVAVALVAGCAAVMAIAGWAYVQERKSLARESGQRGALLRQKREAYAWLAENSTPDARVIAFEDASLFLYSGRQAMRPMILTPVAQFRPEALPDELACMGVNAAAIDARYWVFSDDDFAIEGNVADQARHREAEIEEALPPVFRSTDGSVRIHSIGDASRLISSACH